MRRRDGFVPIGCGVRGGVRRVWRRPIALEALGYPPSLRPPSAILDATGAHEETHMAANAERRTRVMDAAFVDCSCLIASAGHWHGPQAENKIPRSIPFTTSSPLKSAGQSSQSPQYAKNAPRSLPSVMPF